MARTLSPELADIAYRELNEPLDTQHRDQIVQSLLGILHSKGLASASWLSQDPTGYALMYLRWAKFDVQKALKRMENTHKWMQDPDIKGAEDMEMQDFDEIYHTGMIRILGRRSYDGAEIEMLRPEGLSKLKDPRILLKFSAFMLKLSLKSPHIQVCGLVVLESFQHFSWTEALLINGRYHSIMRRNMWYMSNAAPFRLKNILICHQPKFLSFLMAIMKPFMSAKMRQRVQIFGHDHQRLHENFIDGSDLPALFGGSNPDCGEAWWAEQRGGSLPPPLVTSESVTSAASSSLSAQLSKLELPADAAPPAYDTLTPVASLADRGSGRTSNAAAAALAAVAAEAAVASAAAALSQEQQQGEGAPAGASVAGAEAAAEGEPVSEGSGHAPERTQAPSTGGTESPDGSVRIEAAGTGAASSDKPAGAAQQVASQAEAVAASN